MLRKDPDSDAEIRMLRYPKGVLNPEHTHPGGHGIFVLEANFRRIMEHMDPELGYGSRRARLSSTEQLTKATWLVFFTDGAFEIHYKDDE